MVCYDETLTKNFLSIFYFKEIEYIKEYFKIHIYISDNMSRSVLAVVLPNPKQSTTRPPGVSLYQHAA